MPGPREAILRALLRGLVDLALPPRCGACGSFEAAPLCASCRIGLEPDLDPTPVPHLDACVAAVAYAGAVSDWLQRFKYPRPGLASLDRAPAGMLATLIEEAARRAPGEPPRAVAPVPLHPRRLRARGFNPAALLARSAAREIGARVSAHSLRRVRDTPSQTGLDREKRRRNVAGAFTSLTAWEGCVWLVDDVVTTGATLSECARVLRRSGARRVVGVCVARTARSQETWP